MSRLPRRQLAWLVIPLLVVGGPILDELVIDLGGGDFLARLGFGVVLAAAVLLIVLDLVRAERERARSRDEVRSGKAAAAAVWALEGGAHAAGVLSDLAMQGCEILGVERAVVFARDKQHRSSMVAIAGHGIPADLVGRRFPLGRGAVAQVVISGTSAVVDDYSAIAGRIQHPTAHDLHAVAAVPIRVSGEVRAALIVGTTVTERRFGHRETEVLDRLAAVGGIALEHAEMRELLEEAVRGSVQALSAAVEARDNQTGEHSEALVALAEGVGLGLGLTDQQLTDLAAVARLHDVGKIAVPDRILRKRGPLDPAEWEVMKCHTVWGEQILKQVPGLESVARVVRTAHERWDGEGYPDGLSREQIPLLSRVVFACDAYQAMTTDRPYRAALAPELAAEELRAGAGTQFDPRVVDALLQMLAQAANAPAEHRPLAAA